MVTRAAAADILKDVASRSAERKPLRGRRRAGPSRDDLPGVRLELTPKMTWGLVTCVGFVAPFALLRLKRQAFLGAVADDALLWWQEPSGLVLLMAVATLLLAIALGLLLTLRAPRWLLWLAAAPVIGGWALALVSDGSAGVAVYPDGIVARHASWRSVEERVYRWSDVERLETACSGKSGRRKWSSRRRTYFRGVSYRLHLAGGASIDLANAGWDWEYRDIARWMGGATSVDEALRTQGVLRTRTLLDDGGSGLSPYCVRGLHEEFAQHPDYWRRIRSILDISDSDLRKAAPPPTR